MAQNRLKPFRLSDQDVANLEVCADVTGLTQSHILRALIPSHAEIEALRELNWLDAADKEAFTSPPRPEMFRWMVQDKLREIMAEDEEHPLEAQLHQSHTAETMAELFVAWCHAKRNERGCHLKPIIADGVTESWVVFYDAKAFQRETQETQEPEDS